DRVSAPGARHDRQARTMSTHTPEGSAQRMPNAASDTERRSRIADALHRAGLDAVVCALPKHVLLLSGYWPVVGTAVAVATREGATGLLAPEDELALARQGRATELASFATGSLHDLRTAASAVQEPLRACLKRLGVSAARVGFEGGEAVQGASYAAMHLYASGMRDILAHAAPQASLIAADAVLAGLCAILTARERAMVAMACEIAAAMFHQAPNRIRPGVTEPGVAAWLRPLLSYLAPGAARADGFVYCMTGAHAAQAGAAYARSRADIAVAPADTVLVHCNSYLDGFWTDITRTFSAGVPGRRLRAMYRPFSTLAMRRWPRFVPAPARWTRIGPPGRCSNGVVSDRSSRTPRATGSDSERSITTPSRDCIPGRTTCWKPAWCSTWSPPFIWMGCAGSGTVTSLHWSTVVRGC